MDLTVLLEELILVFVSVEIVHLLYHIYRMRAYEKKIDQHITKMDEHLLKMDQHLNGLEKHITKLDEFLEKSKKASD